MILDDLTRPTPSDRVVPFLLRELEKAGIARGDVALLLATGTHGATAADAVAKKAGAEAASSCRLLVHDDGRNVERIGRTSFGTPVVVNRQVVASDFVVGVGGVYPQHSTGFGGGSKLALGVLGRRSIMHLHYKHGSMAGSYEVDNDFRRDLDEIARLIGFRTSISVHVNASREIVRVVCGAHDLYYREAVAFSIDAYKTPIPGDTDVVISNAYPMDVSLTFMRSKGIIPLLHAAPAASRIVLAACPEGVGHHGLFPFVNEPRFARQRHIARRVLVQPRSAPAKALRGVLRAARRRRRGAIPEGSGSRGPGAATAEHPIWLLAPGRARGSLPSRIPGMTAVYGWDELLERVAREQRGRDDLKAVVYPCAPLQVLDLPASRAPLTVPAELGVVD